MTSEEKIAARDKLLKRACAWKDRKFAKRGLSGRAREAAQTEIELAEHDLLEAAEKYEKEK